MTLTATHILTSRTILHSTIPSLNVPKAKKMSGIFNVPKQSSLNVPVECSRNIQKEY